ncbi:MAG: MFS transporter, partial [Clostridia bacterium]
MTINYKKTITACYIANFIQASVVNLTPILFIPLKEQFSLSYSQFGILILANFITQFLIDILFSKLVDKYGFKPFIISSQIICVGGFLLFAFTPFIFKDNVFMGFLISTIIFSSAGGLLELLLSPIIDALPQANNAKAMAML